MRTGLQHAIDARPFGLLPRHLKCISLAMRTPALRGHALPDYPAVFNNHAAHSGVLARPPLLRPRQGQGFAHVMFVGFGGHQPFPLSRDDSLPNTCTSSSPRTRGEVPAVWRGMGGAVVFNKNFSLQSTLPPIDPSVFSKHVGPLPPLAFFIKRMGEKEKDHVFLNSPKLRQFFRAFLIQIFC